MGNSLLRLDWFRRGGQALCGWSGLICSILHFIRHFTRRLFEFFNACPQSLGQFGQLLRSEKDQNKSEDENDLTAAKVK